MERLNSDNMKEKAPTTPPRSSHIEEDIPTITKYTSEAERREIERRNIERWDIEKYKVVPIRGRIILNEHGVKVNNPQGIERFTHEDERLFLNNEWEGPIYDRHGNNVTGRHVTMFDIVNPARPRKDTKRARNSGGRRKRTTKHKKKNK